MSCNVRSPRLPVELIETILLLVWLSPLTTEHRTIFMTSSMLVNKTWMSLFHRMSLKHVYIPKSSYLDAYLATLAGVSPVLDKQTRTLPGLLCQSINVTIDYTPIGERNKPTPTMEKVLSNLLYFLRLLDTTPQLCTLSIGYVHGSIDDVFDFLFYNPLPATLSRLELRYTSWERDYLDIPFSHVSFTLPKIRHLAIFGGSKCLTALLVLMCPTLQTLQIQLLQNNEESSTSTLNASIKGDMVWKCDGACLSIVNSRRCGPNEWNGVLTSVNDSIHTYCRME
ncbi:hypothetical protein J132_06556 [Termitomyces sp. J132]|nr:hypothetical protein J132_06556 [Termitomyces sp. J132]